MHVSHLRVALDHKTIHSLLSTSLHSPLSPVQCFLLPGRRFVNAAIFISGIWTETDLLSMLHTMLRGHCLVMAIPHNKHRKRMCICHINVGLLWHMAHTTTYG